MIDPGKIQKPNQTPKDMKDHCDEINIQNTNNINTVPTFDFPPGYEQNFKSKQTFDEISDLSFPPGFGKANFPSSLPANISSMISKIPKTDITIINKNDNNQNSSDNFQKLQSDKICNDDVNTTHQEEEAHQIILNKESNENLIPSFSNLVYNDESNEPFQPHSKPDFTKYDKLTLCSNLLSIQNFKSEKDQIKKMISAECQLCENKLHKFVDDLGQKNKKIESIFQDLSQKVSDCTTSNLYKKSCNFKIDDVIDTRNETEIINYLREQSDNDILTNTNINESSSKQTPKQETILNLLSILCRIYTKDKKLAFLWVKKMIPFINQVTDISNMKPILLEIKRVMFSDKDSIDESKDISIFIDSKL